MQEKQINKSSSEKKYNIAINLIVFIAMLFLAYYLFQPKTLAAGISIDLGSEGSEGALGNLELLFIFTLLAVAPSLLIMMTSFTRIVMVFSFLRSAIGLQQTPPNQVIIGLSLFLSLFIMQPVIDDINEKSIQPYMENQITQEVALERMQDPLKEFMLKQTKMPDLNLFLSLSGQEEQLETIDTESLIDLDMEVIVPAFITSELKHAFTIGFLLFLPFLVIDMIVSSTLMSMGMVMLPPSTISLPFKLMLFVVVDGWSLIMQMLVQSFL